jgi:hypothetical protein
MVGLRSDPALPIPLPLGALCGHCGASGGLLFGRREQFHGLRASGRFSFRGELEGPATVGTDAAGEIGRLDLVEPVASSCRYFPGGLPMTRRNTLPNALSDSYPTVAATAASFQ